jgi:hypothetical protein
MLRRKVEAKLTVDDFCVYVRKGLSASGFGAKGEAALTGKMIEERVCLL